MLLVLTYSLSLLATSAAAAREVRPSTHPDCVGADRWPAGVAYASLKNAGVFSAGGLDSKATKVVRIASEPIGKGVYRQVHLVTFRRTSGQLIKVVTVSDASKAECSLGGVRLFVVGQTLGEEP